MEVSGIFATAVISCAVIVIVSQVRSEFSLFIQLCTVAVIILAVLKSSAELISQVKQLSVSGEIDSGYISVMFKALIISVGGKIVCDICNDSGNKAIAGCVDIACKISVLLLILPLLQALLTLCAELIK